MAFRRPHPARRTRRLLGAACIVAYLVLGTVIGLSERAADQADETAASRRPAQRQPTEPSQPPRRPSQLLDSLCPLHSAALSTTMTTTVIPRPAPPPTTVLATPSCEPHNNRSSNTCSDSRSAPGHRRTSLDNRRTSTCAHHHRATRHHGPAPPSTSEAADAYRAPRQRWGRRCTSLPLA